MAHNTVRAARLEEGITLDELASRTGISMAGLSLIERGKRTPSKATARALYQYFGGAVSLGAIYDPEFRSGNSGSDGASMTDKTHPRKEG